MKHYQHHRIALLAGAVLGAALHPLSAADKFIWTDGHGDLGVSYALRDTPVADLLGQALFNTLWLVLPAQLLAIVLGGALGLVAAWRRGRAT